MAEMFVPCFPALSRFGGDISLRCYSHRFGGQRSQFNFIQYIILQIYPNVQVRKGCWYLMGYVGHSPIAKDTCVHCEWIQPQQFQYLGQWFLSFQH